MLVGGFLLGVVGIGGAVGTFVFVDGEEEEGGAFHVFVTEDVLSHNDFVPVSKSWLGNRNNGREREDSGPQRNIKLLRT